MSIIKHTKTLDGFTVIELAAIIIIAGLLMSGALVTYKSYLNGRNASQAAERMTTLAQAITEFRDKEGRYPCPAPLGLSFTDPNFGIEDCSLDPTQPTPFCQGGLCRVDGRDTDNDTFPDQVLIGEVPFTTLLDNIDFITVSTTEYKDPWGNKFTYAVTEALTVADTFDAVRGAISLEDENEVSIVKPEGSVHFVLVTHGENRKGAYSPEGTLHDSCITSIAPADLPPSPTASDLERDIENCNHQAETAATNNATFVSALRGLADNNQYFDDIVKYQKYNVRNVWVYSSINRKNVHNTNVGNIGIGIDDPERRLDVAGAIEGIRLYSLGFGGDYPLSAVDDCSGSDTCGICDRNGNNCMPATILGGELDQMYCRNKHPDGILRGITRIEGNEVICEEINFTPPSGACPAGTVLKGFKVNGTLICELVP